MIGSIEVICGPMFSGKSSELLRKIRRYKNAAKKCVIVNYFKDNPFGADSYIPTHDKIFHEAIKTDNLYKIEAELSVYDVVAIDEGQFFSEIADFCEKLAAKGTIVIVAALDATFERKPFGNVCQLIPLCESITKLSAICVKCFQIVSQNQIELFDGKQSYRPVCRKCFFSKTQ